MDREWVRAMELPSDFAHIGGTTTRQYAQIFRGILYRVMPDSFWFRIIAGLRGSKENAQRWLEESVRGATAQEPMIVLEKSVATICYARLKKLTDLEEKGIGYLRAGLSLPTRYPMDGFDKRNMQIILDHPEKACNYTREAFRDLSEETLKKSGGK
jgi:hypothetical protein